MRCNMDSIFRDLTNYGPIAILFCLACFIYYVVLAHREWLISFAKTRVGRQDQSSPSHGQPPTMRSWECKKELILNGMQRYQDVYICASSKLIDLLANVKKRESQHKALNASRRKAQRSNSLSFKNAVPLSDSASNALDMDHVRLTFIEFLWAYIFIRPSTVVLALTGMASLSARCTLHRFGLIKPKWCDPAKVVGDLLLESTLAVHYYTLDEDNEIAGFIFHNFPWVNKEGKMQIASLFTVEIDLRTKRMVTALFENELLTASQAMILLYFFTISANHVKIHALANWACNNEQETWKSTNPFLAQNSLVTIIYNYFGFTCFKSFIPLWVKLKFLSPEWTGEVFFSVFQHGLDAGIEAHPNILDIARYSTFVRFIARLRPLFLQEFQKHKQSFPGVDGEALYAKTVLHSLDHVQAERNLDDPLWLDVSDEKFGMMAEMGRIVRMGFTEDLPGLLFHRRFKGSGHPFYEAVYWKAARLNNFYADNMDTCIVK